MGRNTPILKEIVDVLDTELDDNEHALDTLEAHFHDRLLVDVGNVVTVGLYAEQLRLNITEDERLVVLDYVANQKMLTITVEHVEQVVWDAFRP